MNLFALWHCVFGYEHLQNAGDFHFALDPNALCLDTDAGQKMLLLRKDTDVLFSSASSNLYMSAGDGLWMKVEW